MRLALGKFAREGIEEVRGEDLPIAIEIALRYYLLALEGQRRPPDLPRIRLIEHPDEGVEVEIEIDASVGIALEQARQRQRASAEEVAVHAVFFYLADIDRGAAAIDVQPRPVGT